jgi:hypothetical protein
MTAQKKLPHDITSHQWKSGCRCLTKGFQNTEIVLDKSQVLVGKTSQADCSIDHPSIAFFHALFLVSEEKVEIVDLSPAHQLTVNGASITRQALLSGDKIKIGQLEFLFEAPEIGVEFEERNPKLKKFATPPAPPKAQHLHVVGTQFDHTGQFILKNTKMMVDGEVCDLKLPENLKVSDQTSDIEKLTDVHDLAAHYIDTEEREVVSFYPEKVKREETTVVLSYFCANQLVAMDTFSEKDIERQKVRPQNLSPELAQWFKGQDLILHKDAENYYFHCPTSFQSANEKMLISEKMTSISFGIHQITFQKKVLRKDAKYFAWWRDKESFFRSIGYFLAFLLPVSVLLLVDVPEFKEPEKEKVIIYTTEVIEEAEEQQVAASGSVEMKTEQNTKAQQSPVIDTVKGQPKEQVAENKDAPVEKAEPEKPKPAEQVANKFASLFAKSKVPVDDKKFAESSSSESSTNDAQRKALSGSAVGSAKTVGGGQVKGLAVDAGLSGKKGFKDGKATGKGSFDAGFTATKTVVLGSIDPELLRKLLREYIPQFRYCYQNELIKNPNLSGTINLNFTLNGKGKVVKSNVISKNGEFSNKGLSCMDGVLKMIPFPAPKGGGQVDVKQPLNFSAERTKL